MEASQTIASTIKYLTELKDTLNEMYYWNEHGSYPYDQIQYSIVENAIDELIANIKQCSTFDESLPFFDLLEKISDILCNLLFKIEVDLPDKLDILTREFDTIYDLRLKEYFFEKIKEGEDIFATSRYAR